MCQLLDAVDAATLAHSYKPHSHVYGDAYGYQHRHADAAFLGIHLLPEEVFEGFKFRFTVCAVRTSTKRSDSGIRCAKSHSS
jgi:hypothetical protein